MRGLIVGGLLVGAALAGAAPAQALSDGEIAFVADMDEIGISSDHGYIDNNSREARKVLSSGYGVCNRLHDGWALIDVERNLIIAEATDHAMDNGRDISRDKITALIQSARENLCPDTL